MSKLNPSKSNANYAPYGKAVSDNGNLQFVKSPEQILFETLVSTLYGREVELNGEDGKIKLVKEKLEQIMNQRGEAGAQFALRLAKFARSQMYIRTMPMVLIVEVARLAQAKSIQVTGFKDAITSVISRADELTDLYAYALSVFGNKKAVPLSIKKGIAKAFQKFDGYQFAKYNRDGALKMRDLIRVVHPTPKDEVQSGVFKKIIEGTLEAPYTWEVELSKNGQLSPAERKSPKQLWTELVTREGSGSLGYMALIRNLRNMQEAGLDQTAWKVVAEKLRDPKSVANAKVFPFQLVNAYEIARQSGVPSAVTLAMADAVDLSLGNLPKLGNGVWVILDCSGSMNGGWYGSHHAATTTASPIKTGAIFAAALMKAAGESFDFAFTMFDDHAKHVHLNPRDSVFTSFEKIMNRNSGGGTNLQSALNELPNLGFVPDTVIVLSDMEVNRLDGRIGGFLPNAVKVAINLNSNQTTPLAEHQGWYQLAGWSEQIFKYIPYQRDAASITQRLLAGE